MYSPRLRPTTAWLHGATLLGTLATACTQSPALPPTRRLVFADPHVASQRLVQTLRTCREKGVRAVLLPPRISETPPAQYLDHDTSENPRWHIREVALANLCEAPSARCADLKFLRPGKAPGALWPMSAPEGKLSRLLLDEVSSDVTGIRDAEEIQLLSDLKSREDWRLDEFYESGPEGPLRPHVLEEISFVFAVLAERPVVMLDFIETDAATENGTLDTRFQSLLSSCDRSSEFMQRAHARDYTCRILSAPAASGQRRRWPPLHAFGGRPSGLALPRVCGASSS